MKNIKEIINKFKKSSKDCGSIEIQTILLTKKIIELKKHFLIHKKDLHSKYGLNKIISKRKKNLKYIKRKNFKIYKLLIKKLLI